jgi:hypothetical protein
MDTREIHNPHGQVVRLVLSFLLLMFASSSAVMAETVPALPPLPTAPSVGGWYLHTGGGILYPPFPGAPTGQAFCDYWKSSLSNNNYSDVTITFLPTDSGYGGLCTRPNPWGPGVVLMAQTGYIEYCPPGYTSPAAGGIYPQTCTNVSADNRCPEVATGETPFKLDLPNKLTCSRPDQCLPPNVINPDTGKCEPPETYTITLKPDRTTTEPSTNLGLTVTVENQDHQPPKNPVQVKISLKVDPASGGHDHGNSTRPRGGINSKDCVSDDTCVTLSIGGPGSSGSTSITFNAREASGEHTITATCDKCSNEPQEAKVKVMVEGLEPIPAFPYYALEESDPDHPGQTKVVGATAEHSGNHYLLPAATQVLMQIAVTYHFDPKFKVRDTQTNGMVQPPLLHVNDASLKWGGKFDIKGLWTGSHKEHKRGTSVDLRANEKVGAIPPKLFSKFESVLMRFVPGQRAMGKYLLECTPNESPSKTNPNPVQHNRVPENYCVSQADGSKDTNRHYHVRLLGENK